MTGSLKSAWQCLLLSAWVLLTLLLCARSHAQIYAQLSAITPNGSNHTFTYDLTLSNNAYLHYGDYVTIYDFHGLVPGAASQPINWMFHSALLGRTPRQILPLDSASDPNLTWRYVGPDVGPGPLDLGLFSVDSTSTRPSTTQYVSQAHIYAPGKPGNGRPMYLLAYTGDASASASSHRWWAALSLGLLPLGLILRLRRSA